MLLRVPTLRDVAISSSNSTKEKSHSVTRQNIQVAYPNLREQEEDPKNQTLLKTL